MEQITIFEELEKPTSNWKNKYHKAFDVLKSAKTGHMTRMQYNNPAFGGCPKDDYTDAIDTALLVLSKYFEI